ncbi:DUF6718 family protein [Marinilactibacillus kalidii]|uniref:DUF6718 family protein n=1 Tax=Marinilactibacillus kalidii TaxID=2820274 RepID=UPI001ABEDDC7|nr:DUF6718 family protein [Marinilactibacillus kalidii]
MSYLVAKHFQKKGSVALEIDKNENISEFFEKLTYAYIEVGIQILFVGDFSIYREYEPVTYVNSKKAFEEGIKTLNMIC